MEEDKTKEEKCKNKDCVKHMPVMHGRESKDGCHDYLHNKTCFSKDDLELLSRVLENYINPQTPKITP